MCLSIKISQVYYTEKIFFTQDLDEVPSKGYVYVMLCLSNLVLDLTHRFSSNIPEFFS